MSLCKFGYHKGDRSTAPERYPCSLCQDTAKDGYLYSNRHAEVRVICRRCLSHLRTALADYDTRNPGPTRAPAVAGRTLIVD